MHVCMNVYTYSYVYYMYMYIFIYTYIHYTNTWSLLECFELFPAVPAPSCTLEGADPRKRRDDRARAGRGRDHTPFGLATPLPSVGARNL